MSAPKVAVLVGSLREGSYNKRLAKAIGQLAGDRLSLHMVRIDDLPLYNQDMDGDYPANCKRLKQDIESADAVVVVTPEYNRSMPGVLKNAIDHASRPYGQSAWAGKPAGVLGISVGAIGTALSQQHLRNVLAYLDVHTLGQPEVFIQMKEGLFDEAGNIGADSKQFLQNWMDRYVAWIKKHAG